MNLLRGKSEKSSLLKHCREEHDNVAQEFSIKVTGVHGKDGMTRQIAEAVAIREVPQGQSMKNKTEWNFVKLPRTRVEQF